MSKYLSFKGAGLHFLLPINNIVELYDADASPEPVDKVLVGDVDRVYWRGTSAVLLDLNTVLALEKTVDTKCFIVCRGSENSGNYCILKVDSIHELFDVAASSFRLIEMDNAALKCITDQVCIMQDCDQLFYLMHEPEKVFKNIKHLSDSTAMQGLTADLF